MTCSEIQKEFLLVFYPQADRLIILQQHKKHYHRLMQKNRGKDWHALGNPTVCKKGNGARLLRCFNKRYEPHKLIAQYDTLEENDDFYECIVYHTKRCRDVNFQKRTSRVWMRMDKSDPWTKIKGVSSEVPYIGIVHGPFKTFEELVAAHFGEFL